MQCYLVGGAVRDKLLGYPHSEHDWVVVGSTPEAMLAAGYKPVGKDFPVFLHPTTNEEYALARTERKSGNGYHGFICYSSPDVTLEQDLARRDLTINAMAEDEAGHIIDPYGGRNDLANRQLRHVSPAFSEDPLRILRVARFAARYRHLGFEVAPETMTLMTAMVQQGEINHLVAERIWKETERAFGEPNPEVFFSVLRQCGALAILFPELVTATTGLTALARSAQTTDKSLIRFCTLCVNLKSTAIQQLCERTKVPNEYRELALLSAAQAPMISAVDNPQQAFAVLEASDALRRPERFAQLLDVCAQLLIPTQQLQRMQYALQIAAAIIAQPLLAQGFSGKALGEQLQRERLRAIEENWQ